MNALSGFFKAREVQSSASNRDNSPLSEWIVQGFVSSN